MAKRKKPDETNYERTERFVDFGIGPGTLDAPGVTAQKRIEEGTPQIDPRDWSEQYPVDRPDVPELQEQIPQSAMDNSVIGGFVDFMRKITPDDLSGNVRGTSGWLSHVPLYKHTVGPIAIAPFSTAADILNTAAWGSEQVDRALAAATSAMPGGIQTLTWEDTEDVTTFQAAVASVGLEAKRIREGGARPSDVLLFASGATSPFILAGYLAEDSPIQDDDFDIMDEESRQEAFSGGMEKFFSGLGDAALVIGTDPLIVLGGASSIVRYGTKGGKIAGISNQRLVTPRQVDGFATRLDDQAKLIDDLGVDGARSSGRVTQEGENLIAAMQNTAAGNQRHIWVKNSSNQTVAQNLLGRTSVDRPFEASALAGAMAGHQGSWAKLRQINPALYDDLALAHGIDTMIKAGPGIIPPPTAGNALTDDALALADDLYNQALHGAPVVGQLMSRGGSRGRVSSATRAANAWRKGADRTQFERNPLRRTGSRRATTQGGWVYDFIEGTSASRPITTVRWLGKGSPSGVLFLKGDDFTTSNREMKAWLAKSGLTSDEAATFYARWTASRTVDERKILVDEMESAAVKAMAPKLGVTEKAAMGAYNAYIAKRAAALGQIAKSKSNLYVDPDTGEIVKVPRLYGDLDNATPLLDTKIFRRVVRNNKAYKYAEDAQIAADYMNSLWKVSVLLRLGYTARNLTEGALRSFAVIGLAAANPKAFATMPANSVYRIRALGKRKTLKQKQAAVTEAYQNLIEARKVLQAARSEAGVDDWIRLIDEANDMAPALKKLQAKFDRTEKGKAQIAALRAEAKEFTPAITKLRNKSKTKKGLTRQEQAELNRLQKARQSRNDKAQRIRDKAMTADERKEFNRLKKMTKSRQEKAAAIKADKIQPATPELTRMQRKAALIENEIDNQLAAFEEILSEFTRLQNARRLTGRSANRMDDGTMMPGAFMGDEGAIAAQLASADRTVYATFEFGAGARADILRESADFKRMNPYELDGEQLAQYWAEYTTRLNNRFRQDYVGRMIMRGASKDDIRAFILSPQGKNYREQISSSGNPMSTADEVEEHINELFKIYDNEVPTEAIRKILLDREISTGELQSLMARETLPEITGRLKGASPQGFSGVFKGLNNATGVAMKWLGTIPETKILRHPFYNNIYTASQKRLYALAARQGADMTDDATLARINRASHREALQATRDTMYTIERLSNSAEFLRFLSPFFPAWENAIRTWGRIAYQKPQIVGYGNLLWNIPNNLGLVVDDKGEPVEYSSPFRDDQTYIVWPKEVQTALQKISGVDVDVSSRQSGLNVIFPGGQWWFPGVGPMSQIPTSLVLRGKPEDQEILRKYLGEEIYNQITPFGNVNNSLIESLMPTLVRRAKQMTNGASPEGAFLSSYTMILEDAYIQAQIDNRKMTDKDFKEVQKKADAFWRFQILAAAAFPFQMRGMSEFQVQRDAWAKLIDDQSIAYADKIRIFTEEYGTDFLAITRSGTERETGLSPNLRTWDRITKNKDLVSQLNRIDPKLVGMFGNMGNFDDPFSFAVYGEYFRHSVTPDGRPIARKLTPAEVADLNEVQDGWKAYFEIKDMIEEAAVSKGYSGYTVKGAEPLEELLQQAREDIAERYPAWGFVQDSMTTMLPNYIRGARILVQNAELVDEDSTIEALAKYLNIREQAVDALSKIPENKTEERRQVKNLAYAAAFELRQSDIGFADFYDMYLDRDNFQKVLNG